MQIAPTQTTQQSAFTLEIPKEDVQILIAEDEDATRQLLQFSLEREGYQVVTVRNGKEALQAFAANPFDMVILDINMPIIDGWTVCAELRKRTDVPIMMLTANARPDDVVHGIRLGADNYVTKPFTLKELRARVQAVLRRAMQRNQHESTDVMRCGDITLNESTCEVTVRGKKVNLTPNEYRLLKYFLEHPNTPISKEDLLTAVWEYQYQFCEDLNFIRVTIRRLRSKVEENSSSPKYLKTVHGRGYKLCTSEESTPSVAIHGATPQLNQNQLNA
ncbi:MAG: response regulator transcription factor [Chloroflexota bacterium]